MDNPSQSIAQLFSIRNKYGAGIAAEKIALIQNLQQQRIISGKAWQQYNDALFFLIAFPDNREVYQLALSALQKLEATIHASESLQTKLFNTGVTGSEICGAFSFEVVKWLRETYGELVTMDSIFADDSQMTSILSVVIGQVQSEILQDANTDWKKWIEVICPDGDELDKLIKVFDEASILPEVKDELWTAIGVNLVVKLHAQEKISGKLFTAFYHKSLIKHTSLDEHKDVPVKVEVSKEDETKIIECGRTVLVRHIREIDPVSFSLPGLISYYKLQRGYTIAFYRMRNSRRHPVDSYTSYVAFKNGLPVAYGGAWMLFDSCRMALNIFASYRGGESMYICEQILNAHRHVYKVNRFSVDPYQIGKDNSDGVHSGAFWVYYKLGFRSIRKHQYDIAEDEAAKLQAQKGYRSSFSVLSRLADSKMELVLNPKAKPVRFDAADLSITYANIVKKNYGGNRKAAEETCLKKLIALLRIKHADIDQNLNYVLRNWCVFAITQLPVLKKDKALRETLKKALLLKASGEEGQYIQLLQRSKGLRLLLQGVYEAYL